MVSKKGKWMNKTTVVIPNFNGIEYLKDCLESIKNYPTIVVDNGSTDGSVEFIETCFPQVQLICNEENMGFCIASNQGMQAATTEYVFLLNNDTKVDAFCIETLERAMEAEKKSFSIQAKMLAMSEPDVIDDAGDLYCALGWAFALGKGKNKSFYSKRTRISAACGGAVLYRKSVLDQIGYLDENHFAYLEDIDLGYRARIYGYANYMEPEAIVYHKGSATSGSRYNVFKVDLASRNSVYLAIKNMPLLQYLLNLPFLLLGILIKWLFFVKKGFGKNYIKGIWNGYKLALSKEGRKKKVPFQIRNLRNYFLLQIELWWNTIRRFAG